MGELIPRDYYDPVPVSRKAAKALSRVRDQSLVERAAIAAREQNAAYTAELRIDNGYRLTARTVVHATQLNQLVTHASQGNPGLEMMLRNMEASTAFAAQAIIGEYMTR
jgi:hypothetical protein